MKPFVCSIPAALLAFPLFAVDTPTYTNYLRQFQTPSGVVWDCSETVDPNGSKLSSLAINPGGARFDLWTIKSTPLTEYLLNTCYVGTYVPLASVSIRTEDLSSPPPPTPEQIAAGNLQAPWIARTRADRPFYVDVTVSGLLSGAADPDASKSVKLMRHVQSYGVGGTGVGIDRTLATLLTQASITTNGMQTLTYVLNSVPGADRAKVRGEERFSVFTIADIRPPTYNVPETQISSQFIQFWPVADGTITGITPGQIIRMAMPQVTFTLNDLYPNSRTFAQVYKGSLQSGVTGTVVTGSNLVINDSIPSNRVLIVNNYDKVFDSVDASGVSVDPDGLWTMELLTVTPFGTDRLAYVSFTLDRTLKLNGTFTTIE
ncbi:MAG: hypothetical protein NTV46_13795 [Verrucomicrobia bacterium]|nr:hypothetical protein [Verrucomicrobiota bacterium]